MIERAPKHDDAREPVEQSRGDRRLSTRFRGRGGKERGFEEARHVLTLSRTDQWKDCLV